MDPKKEKEKETDRVNGFEGVTINDVALVAVGHREQRSVVSAVTVDTAASAGEAKQLLLEDQGPGRAAADLVLPQLGRQRRRGRLFLQKRRRVFALPGEGPGGGGEHLFEEIAVCGGGRRIEFWIRRQHPGYEVSERRDLVLVEERAGAVNAADFSANRLHVLDSEKKNSKKKK
ncbi:hypothetical protein STAS_16156 [Striga asiatica]|uniref:Uncharacterized protein n=1 Tax=Striga asiatica TaxID=4170 RepID=A0A5A7Q534_STRAF|nr:hypothetical protein STAS_16156 [Striga asiatica]